MANTSEETPNLYITTTIITTHALDTGVVYIDTIVTGTFLGHQIFQDTHNQVIRPEPVVVRVPVVFRVPVPDHVGPGDAPREPTAPAPRARSPRLFMHGMNRYPLPPAANPAPAPATSSSDSGVELRTPAPTTEEAGTDLAAPSGEREFAPFSAYTYRSHPRSRRLSSDDDEDEETVPRSLPPLPSSLAAALADLAVRQDTMVDEAEDEDEE